MTVFEDLECGEKFVLCDDLSSPSITLYMKITGKYGPDLVKPLGKDRSYLAPKNTILYLSGQTIALQKHAEVIRVK